MKALHPLSDASKLKSAQKDVEDVKRAAKAKKTKLKADAAAAENEFVMKIAELKALYEEAQEKVEVNTKLTA